MKNQNETPLSNTSTPLMRSNASLPMAQPPQTTARSSYSPAKNKGRWESFVDHLKHLNNKQKALIVLAISLTLAGAIALFMLFRQEPPPPVPLPAVVEEEVEEAPTTVQSKLTGLQVSPEVNERQVTGVMIENSPEARPQAGLREAGLVFEAVSEGGITRFLALFQDTSSDYVGPIRSVRPYYIDFLMPFDASVAHVGGSPQGLADVRALGVKTLTQFDNPGAYRRINTRYAPHNMYSSIPALKEVEKQRGFNKSEFEGFKRFEEEQKPATTPPAKNIDFQISSALYNVRFEYDKSNNNYKRFMAGTPHLDDQSGKQITPKVVIAITMNRGVHSNGVHTTYQTTGSGKMHVFQNGKVTEGTWKKADRSSQFTFQDSEGKDIKLNPGKTWVTIVSAPNAVSYTP